MLHGGGSGLLGQLTQHLSGATGTLATQLSGLKETASQLLASGQEALAGVHQTGAAAVGELSCICNTIFSANFGIIRANALVIKHKIAQSKTYRNVS